MEITLFVTGDGSHSLHNPLVEENYHSRHGAWSESMYVFLGCGYYALPSDLTYVNVLEIGMGTGLNAFQTLAEGMKSGKSIIYQTIELYPVTPSIYKEINYPDFADIEDAKALFMNMHDSSWGESICLTPEFEFTKFHQPFSEYNTSLKFDLVYFDAFSPDKQPELWDAGVFEKLFAMMNPGAILVTYCAKGYVRRNMLAAGMLVEKLPGPPGKREMLRARKP